MMEKRRLYMILGSLAVVSMLCVPFAFAADDESKNSVQTVLQTSQDLSALAEMGMTLEQAPAVKSLPTISEEDAIKAASEYMPVFSKTATNIKAEYQIMTNPNFQAFSESALAKNPTLQQNKHLEKTPVYIVSFEGIKKEGHDFKGSNKKPTVFSEQNVVVDASTGEILYSYNYR